MVFDTLILIKDFGDRLVILITLTPFLLKSEYIPRGKPIPKRLFLSFIFSFLLDMLDI